MTIQHQMEPILEAASTKRKSEQELDFFVYHLRERCKKKKMKKKLTSVSFMYVCVAGNCEMLVCFPFFPQQ